jgi:TRAP-type C4-dicarboxylate transport system substrate-binding protein
MLHRTLGAVAVAAIAFAAVPAMSQVRLVFNNYAPPASPVFRTIPLAWKQAVEQATQGRVLVEFTASSLAPPPRQLKLVQDRGADAAMMVNTFFRNQVALPGIAMVWNISEDGNSRAFSVALWRTYEKFFKAADEYKGVELVTLQSTVPTQLFNSKRPVENPGDLRGLKIRVSADLAPLIEALGGAAVPKPAAELFELINSGVLDGTTADPGAILSFKLTEKLKFATFFPGGFSGSDMSIIVNPAAWAAIPEADRKAILAVSGEKHAFTAGAMADRIDREEWAAQAGGIKVSQPSPALMKFVRDQGAKNAEDWVKAANAKGVDGKAALAYFREQVKVVRAMP